MKNTDDEILNERYKQMRESANSYIETLARDSFRESLDSRAQRLNDYIDSYYEAKELGEEAGWQKGEYKSLLQTIKREFGTEIYQAVVNDTPELAFKILRKQSK
jgi:hypothetical protein